MRKELRAQLRRVKARKPITGYGCGGWNGETLYHFTTPMTVGQRRAQRV